MHPDQWVFKNMHGKNGQADITASGSVEKLRRAQAEKRRRTTQDRRLLEGQEIALQR